MFICRLHVMIIQITGSCGVSSCHIALILKGVIEAADPGKHVVRKVASTLAFFRTHSLNESKVLARWSLAMSFDLVGVAHILLPILRLVYHLKDSLTEYHP